MKNKRRNFLKNLTWFLLSITSLIFIFPAFFYLLPKKEEKGLNIFTDENGNPVPEDAVKEGSYKLGFSQDGPTILIKREGKLYAFSAVCTHLGCIVKWVPERNEFFCPCHAGRFDANGTAISGPPPSPLRKYKVDITSEGIIVLS